jgi:hypothetical protein
MVRKWRLALFKVAFATAATSLVMGCSGGSSSSQSVSNETLGIQLEKLSGDNQITTPSSSWSAPLRVRTTVNGQPLPSIEVTFSVIGTAGASLVNPTLTTDSSGVAQTTAIAPNLANEQITIRAAMKDGSGVTFRLETRSYPESPVMTLRDPVTLSTAYAQQRPVTANITTVPTAVKWCVSENQNSRPATGSSPCVGGVGAFSGWTLVRPTSFTLSSTNGVKTVYVWVADQFDQVSLNPSNASIFLDTVAPGVPVVTLSDQGSGSTTDTASSIVNLSVTNDGDASFWCIITQMSVDPAPTTPARNAGCWVSVKPATVTMVNLGLNKTYIWTKDLAENISPAAGEAFINYTTIVIADPTLTVRDPVTLSQAFARTTSVNLSIGNDATAARWCVSEVQSSRPVNTLATCVGGIGPLNGWSSSRPTTMNLSGGDGVKTVYLWVGNPLLNTNANAVSRTITLDTVAPSIPLADLTDPNTGLPNFTNQSTVNLSITNDTDAVRWCLFERSSVAAPPSIPAFNSGCWVAARPTTVALGSTGTRRVYVYTKDIAENVSPAPAVASINYTTTPPSAPLGTLRDPETNSTTLAKNQTVNLSISSPVGSVRWCISESQNFAPATGTDTCTGGAGPSSGWFTTSPTTFALTSADGAKTVYLWVADGANNVNSTISTATITLDRTAPAQPTVSVSDPNSNSTTFTNQIIANLSITADTDATRWCRIVQAAVSPDPAPPTLTDVCWVTSRPTTVVLEQTGDRKVFVFTRDAAGNIGAAGASQINYSTDNPSDPSVTLADSTTALTTFARGTAANLTIANDTGASRWCVSETQTTRPSFGTSTCTGGNGPSNGWSIAKPTTFTLSSGDGLKRVYVWTANSANTVNNNPSSATLTLDTVAPTTASVMLSDPNTGSATDTNLSTVNMAISGEVSDVTAWCTIEQPQAQAAPSVPNFANVCWVTSKPVTQDLGATGQRRVYVYFRDRAFNISSSAGTASINYSTSAATTPALALSDPTTASSTHARQSSVNVAITSDTGATRWCLSSSQTTRPSFGTSNCLGGTGPANGWFNSRPNTFSLGVGDGGKTVYLWTADASNNTSATPVSASITLDTLGPSVPFVTLADTITGSTAVTNQAVVDLSVQFDTDATRWCVIEQALATLAPAQPAWNAGCWVNVRPTSLTLATQGQRRVFVFTQDIAFNVSAAGGVAQINYTTTPPADPSLVLTSPTTGSTSVTKDLINTTSITSPTGTVRWCLSETQTSRPTNGTSTCTGGTGPASGWFTSLPSSFQVTSGDGLKTVYLWVSDGTNNVNANTVVGTISLDTAPPGTPTVSMSDPNTGSTSQTNQFTVDLSITADTDAFRWCPIIQSQAAAAPAAPALNSSCWLASRPATQLIDATGARRLYVFTRDLAGNIGTAGTADITYQVTPPSDPTISLSHSVTGLTDFARTQSLSISIGSDTGATRWCVSETQSTRPAQGTASCNGGAGPSGGWFTTRPTTFSLSSSDAQKRVYVWVADSFNNVNSNASSNVITLDTVAPLVPSVTLSDPNTNSSTETNQAAVNLNIATTADALAWCVIEQDSALAAPSVPAFGDSCFVTSRPTTLTLAATGSRRSYVFTRDRAYNVSATGGQATILYSTTAPVTATLSAQDATTGLATFIRQVATQISITGDTGAARWCVSETQTTRPALGTSSCAGGQGTSVGWHTTRPTTFNVTASDGAKTIYVWTANLANTTSAAAGSASITLDRTAPAIPTVELSDPNTGNTAFTNQSAVNLAITDDTDATGWCVIEQASATAAPTAPLFNNGCWVTTRPTTLSLGALGNRRAYVYTRDPAQNISLAAAIANINYSTTPPSNPVLVITNSVTGSRFFTNDRDVSLQINNPAGTVAWCISQTQSTRPATGSATCNGGTGPSNGWFTSMPSTFQLSTGDGVKTVYIWVANGSNNTNSTQSSATITLLENPPSAPTVAISDPNTNSTTLTNQSTVNLSVTADTGATAWCSIAQDAALAAPAAPAVSNTCWLLVRPTSVSLGALGNRRVYVFLRDAAMNVSNPGSAVIDFNLTSPGDPSLSLAHSVTALTTHARTTALNITIGSDTGAVRWCVSESQTVKPSIGTSTCIGGSGPSSGWFTSRPTTYTLTSGDGLKRVYVWIANATNNVNDNAVSQTIMLDTVAPSSFTITGLTGGSDVTPDGFLGSTLTPTLNWNSSPGAANYNVQIRNSAGSTVVCATQTTAALSYTFSGCTLTDGTTYRAYVTSADDALNTTNATNNAFSFTVSLTPPGSFSISGASGAQDTTADQWSGTSLPTVSWGTSSSANQYLVQVLANDGFTVMCSQQVKASGILSHDYSTTGCSALADNTLFQAEVFSRDVAGNIRVATNSVFIFRTDLTPPTVSITANPAAQSIVSTANFTFTTSDSISGVNSTQCRLDAGGFLACDSPTTHAYTGISDGNRTFTVRATDRVGFTQTANYVWDIDTVLPSVFNISGATGPTDSVIDNQLRNDTEITAHWTTSATATSYEVTILNANDSVRCGMVVKSAGSTSHTFSGCTIPNPGTYKIKVVAKRGFGTAREPTPMTITAVTDSITAVITSASGTVTSGNSVQLTLVGYQNGVQMTSNLLSPTFVITGGTSTGTFSNITYIGSGTYTADFNGVVAGTAATISATTTYFGGFTSVTPATVQVTVGGVNAGQSNVTVSKSTVQADNSDTVTVTASVRDINNNVITGAMVSAAFINGTSTGTFSGFTETPASSGNYVSTFSGVTSGTASNVRITANGIQITAQPTITVLPGPPVKIGVTGPTTLNTHACAGPYTVRLQDFHNNQAQAAANIQINFTGLPTGNFSLSPACATVESNTNIFLGGSVAPPVYVLPRGPGTGINLTFADNAANLTSGTLTVAINGNLAWIGQTASFNWNSLAGVPGRSMSDGFIEPRGAWFNTANNNLYLTDTYNFRVVRMNSSTKTITGWIGIVDGTEDMSCPTFPLPSPNGATPGWCVRGTPARSFPSGLTNWDGFLNLPAAITGDGTFLYVVDRANHRIARYLESTGEFRGWYGRVGTNVPSACTSGTPAANSATPNWCYGGTSIQSSTAPANTTNWDGIFEMASTWDFGIKSYADTASGNQLLIFLDGALNRIVRMRVNSTNIVWEGWAGRTLAITGMSNGYNTTGCNTIGAAGDATPGWCLGGTSQPSPNPSIPGGCVGPGTCFSSPTPYTNYDNMFNTVRGLAIHEANPALAYFADSTNGRMVRFNIDTGRMTGWAGRVVRDTGFQATGGTNCNATTGADTGWCVGGAPQYQNYRFYTGTGTNFSPGNDNRPNFPIRVIQGETDGTNFYATTSENRVFRSSLSASIIGTTFQWVGRIGGTPTGGASGCTTASIGFLTPGWCVGGSAQAGRFEGHYNSPFGIAVDLSSTPQVMYTVDVSNSKIQTHDFATGESLGWIGAARTSPTSWSTSFSKQMFGFVGAINDDLGFGSGNITNYNSNTTATVEQTFGLTRSGSFLFVADTANNRIKRYNAANGTFEGWYGKAQTIPTGIDDACTSISGGGLTPLWCFGGTPGGLQIDQNTVNAGTGELSRPRGLAADATYIYTSDHARNRVVRIVASSGAFAGWLGRTGATVSGMTGFDALNTCSSTAANTFTAGFCGGGSHSSANTDGPLSGPRGVAVDSASSRLYVADTGNHRINMYSLANDTPTGFNIGAFLGFIGRASVTTSTGVAGPTTGGANASCRTPTLTNVTATPIWCLGIGGGGSSSSGGNTALNFMGFNAPQGVSFGNNAIYVADTGAHRIQKFNATTGAHLGWIGRVASAGSTPSGEGTGSGLTAGVCALTALNAANPGWCLRGGSQASGGTVFDGAFNTPTDLWVDPNTNFLYVVDNGNNRIVKINKTSGAFVGWRGLVGAVSPALGGGTGCSTTLVDQITPTWCTGGVAKAGSQLGAFYNPVSITGDTNFIYVTDSFNSRVVALPK